MQSASYWVSYIEKYKFSNKCLALFSMERWGTYIYDDHIFVSETIYSRHENNLGGGKRTKTFEVNIYHYHPASLGLIDNISVVFATCMKKCYLEWEDLLGKLDSSTKYKRAYFSVIVSPWAGGVTSKRMLVNTKSDFQISPENRQLWQMDKCSEMFVYTDIFQHRK